MVFDSPGERLEEGIFPEALGPQSTSQQRHANHLWPRANGVTGSAGKGWVITS